MRKIINFTHATLDGYIDDPRRVVVPILRRRTAASS